MKYLVTDNDKKFCHEFFHIFKSENITGIPVPPFSPKLNAFAESWVRTVKESCLDKLLIRSEEHLQNVMKEFILYYNYESPHQFLGSRPPEPYKRYECQRSGKIVKSPLDSMDY